MINYEINYMIDNFIYDKNKGRIICLYNRLYQIEILSENDLVTLLNLFLKTKIRKHCMH